MSEDIYDFCEECGEELHGEPDSPGRDWTRCAECGKLLCFKCNLYPATGICEDCIAAAEDEDMELYLPEGWEPFSI